MIESTDNKVVYTIAAGTGNVFTFPIRFFGTSEIICYKRVEGIETKLVSGTDFSVSYLDGKTSFEEGGKITLLTAIPVGGKLSIIRELPMIQMLNLPEFGKIPASQMESQLDKIVMMVQQLNEVLLRCVKLDPTSSETAEQLLLRIFNAAAAAVASAAAAAVSETNAGNSATSAANSATSAANSATSAANSATSAANSATSASNSASTAVTKAAEAEASKNAASAAAAVATSYEHNCIDLVIGVRLAAYNDNTIIAYGTRNIND